MPKHSEMLLPQGSIKGLKCVSGLPKRKQLFVIVEKEKFKWINMFRWLFRKGIKIEGTGEFVVTKTGDFETLSNPNYTFAAMTRENRECLIEAETPKEAFDKFVDVKKWPNEKLHEENGKYLRG